MAKISASIFNDELQKQFNEEEQTFGDMANYEHNIRHNAGRHYYVPIYKCTIEGETYYYARGLNTANTNLGIIKRNIARYIA